MRQLAAPAFEYSILENGRSKLARLQNTFNLNPTMNENTNVKTETVCALCGGETVRVEVMAQGEKLSLVGDNGGRFISRDAMVPIERAQVCIACGHTQLFADPEKVRKRILSRLGSR